MVIPFENINKMEVQKTEINDECLSILATDHESLISDTYKFAYFNDTAKVFKSIAELLPVAADILAESGRSYSPQKAPFPHPSDIFQAKDAKIPHYLELASDSEMSDDRLPRKNENIEDGIARRKLDKPEKRQNWWGPRRSSLDESQLSNTTTIPTAKVSEPSAVVKYSWWSPRMSLSLGLLSTAAPSEAQLLQKKLDFQALFAFPESEQLIASNFVSSHRLWSVPCKGFIAPG